MAKGQGKLAELVRNQQDLLVERQTLQNQLAMSLSAATAPRDAAHEAALGRRHSENERKLSAIADVLNKEFPDYATFAKPGPLPIGEVQKLLRPEEALVQFVFFDPFQLCLACDKNRCALGHTDTAGRGEAGSGCGGAAMRA